jgi:tetratricopeptide (TPR) repeat protein
LINLLEKAREKNMKKIKVSQANVSLSNEYLQKAYEAKTTEQVEKNIKKAIELNPNNISAMLFLVESFDDPFEQLAFLSGVILQAEDLLKDDNYFSKEYIGDFWGFHETRPYMRARQMKVLSLIDVNYYYEAIHECEDLLRLSKNDNLGMRYILMGLYAFIEDYKSSQKLFKKFDEDSFMFLLPYGLSLFRSNQQEKAKAIFNIIDEKYPSFRNIFIKNLKPTNKEIDSMRYGIPMGQSGEVFIALADNEYLITNEFKIWYKSIKKN